MNAAASLCQESELYVQPPETHDSQSYLIKQRVWFVNQSLKKTGRLVLLKPPIPFDNSRPHGLRHIPSGALMYLVVLA